ncbi:MAG: indole-3-glycerol phosphate synthase TrpC [Lachnospiraceae bacterium]|nr:indole-3-glycerol phosphate synthase TrpC [Lachnospiraceae bacterium]
MAERTILDEIADYTRGRVEKYRSEVSLQDMRARARSLDPDTGFKFENALRKDNISFICEVKKASPSKGIIAGDFPYLKIALDYEAAGADAISVLTEPNWFLGNDKYLTQIKSAITIPVLRKDFTVDEYMIYQARVMGADAVLLIVSLLSDDQLCEYLDIADELGLSALTECHDEEEIEKAISLGARIIGVNNRNLKNFSVNPLNALSLRAKVPSGILFVSESGISERSQVESLEENGVDAVLIGETLMKSEDKKGCLRYLRGF